MRNIVRGGLIAPGVTSVAAEQGIGDGAVCLAQVAAPKGPAGALGEGMRSPVAALRDVGTIDLGGVSPGDHRDAVLLTRIAADGAFGGVETAAPALGG